MQKKVFTFPLRFNETLPKLSTANNIPDLNVVCIVEKLSLWPFLHSLETFFVAIGNYFPDFGGQADIQFWYCTLKETIK